MTTHELKTWPEFFAPVATGVKTFEVRRDDRGFRVGDRLRLREWHPQPDRVFDEDRYTGREVTVTVTYIFSDAEHRGLSVEPGYVVMAIALTDPPEGLTP